MQLVVEAFKLQGSSNVRNALRMSETEPMVGASIELDGGKVHDPLGLLQVHDINPNVLPHPKVFCVFV